jgi:hypothetical protein
MPCIKVTDTKIPYNPPLSSQLGPFTSEAECLEACKEGACCNGGDCTVKPQCQCVCEDGSCCGPDTTTISIGTVSGIEEKTVPVCRSKYQISRKDCIKNGGIWRCNTLCDSNGVCLSLTGKNEPIFKGAGTTCSPNPCGKNCYHKNVYRASLNTRARSVCGNCSKKSKVVGLFATRQEALDALAAYQAEVLTDPECVIDSQNIFQLETMAECYDSAPDDTWTLKSTYQTANECESNCGVGSCAKGMCIKVGGGDCVRRDCPDNPDIWIPAPCDWNCGDGTYYEWECYKFAPGETIADYQWAIDYYEGYEVDWCTETYYSAYHDLYMPVDKCPADAAQYWPDPTCPFSCLQKENPLP